MSDSVVFCIYWSYIISKNVYDDIYYQYSIFEDKEVDNQKTQNRGVNNRIESRCLTTKYRLFCLYT